METGSKRGDMLDWMVPGEVIFPLYASAMFLAREDGKERNILGKRE